MVKKGRGRTVWENLKDIAPWVLLGWALIGGFFGILYWFRYGRKEVELIKRELSEHPEKFDGVVLEKMHARLDNAILEPIPSVVFGAVGGPLSVAIYFLHP